MIRPVYFTPGITALILPFDLWHSSSVCWNVNKNKFPSCYLLSLPAPCFCRDASSGGTWVGLPRDQTVSSSLLWYVKRSSTKSESELREGGDGGGKPSSHVTQWPSVATPSVLLQAAVCHLCWALKLNLNARDISVNTCETHLFPLQMFSLLLRYNVSDVSDVISCQIRMSVCTKLMLNDLFCAPVQEEVL